MRSGTPVADLTDQPAVRTSTAIDADGNIVVERAPWGRFTKWVHPSGAVVRIPSHNGRASAESDADPYKLWKQDRLYQVGSIPYWKCLQLLPLEIMNGLLPPKWYKGRYPIVPEHLRNRPRCTTAKNGGSIGMGNACACVEELIEWRKNQQKVWMEDIEVRINRMNDKEHSLASAVRDMAAAVADAATPKNKK